MRKRMINPGIWTNRKFIRCSDKDKLLFIGLFSTADDYGKLWYDLLSIKASIFPCDNLSEDELRTSIRKLSELDLLATDEKIIKIHGWNNHQTVPKPQKSNIPDPILNQCGNNIESLPNQYSTDTELIPNQYGNVTEPVPNRYGLNTELLPNQYSNDTEPLPNKERKKERNKRKKEMKESNLSLINKVNQKELSTKEVRDILFENKSKFNITEYDHIESLINKGKHLSARIKIDEKIKTNSEKTD